jgi:isopropylmalate/homocitrate/citramalate synthase
VKEQEAQRIHEEEMAELKVELDDLILDQLECGEAVAPPKPFNDVKRDDVEEERKRLIDNAKRAINRGWQHAMAAEREFGDDGESVSDHDAFTAQIEASKAQALRRIDEIWALVSAFNDARLDIYNALKKGNRKGAGRIGQAFLDRPAIAP